MVVSILGVTLLANVLGKTDVVNGRLLPWKDFGCCPKRSILVDVLCDSSILNLLANYYHYCDIAYSWATCVCLPFVDSKCFFSWPTWRGKKVLNKSGINDSGGSNLALTTVIIVDNWWGLCPKAGSRSPSSSGFQRAHPRPWLCPIKKEGHGVIETSGNIPSEMSLAPAVPQAKH